VRDGSLRRMLPAALCRILEILLQEPLVFKTKRLSRALSLRSREEQDGGVVAVHHGKVKDRGHWKSSAPLCIS
jgi:hypothetical protein